MEWDSDVRALHHAQNKRSIISAKRFPRCERVSSSTALSSCLTKFEPTYGCDGVARTRDGCGGGFQRPADGRGGRRQAGVDTGATLVGFELRALRKTIFVSMAVLAWLPLTDLSPVRPQGAGPLLLPLKSSRLLCGQEAFQGVRPKGREWRGQCGLEELEGFAKDGENKRT